LLSWNLYVKIPGKAEEVRKMKANKQFFYLVVVFVAISLICVFGCKKKSEETGENKISTKPEQETSAEIEKPVDTEPLIDEGEFVITISPRDGRSVRSLDRPLFVSFSRGIAEGDFSYSISPDPGGWSESWKRRRQVVLSHANPFQPGASYEFEVTVESEEAKKTVQFTVYGPSSLELIDADEESGVLDLDTAWTYRLQRLYEPDRLPDKYQSPTSIKCGTWLLKKYQNAKNDLKEETVKALKPYFLRPSHPESVFTRRVKASSVPRFPLSSITPLPLLQEGDRPTEVLIDPNWNGFESSKFPITVWTTFGEEGALDALELIDDKNMWSMFEGLLSVTPPSDINEKTEDGEPNLGIDGHLDIYLVSPTPYLTDNTGQGKVDIHGWCLATREGSKVTPTYILVHQGLSKRELCGTLAHEIFHSFQAAIDFNERDWWIEGTAVWAEDLIDEGIDTEQDFVEDAFILPDNLLETLTSDQGDHAYGIYLFPYYLSSQNDDDMIARMWESCRSKDDIEAIDDVLDGKFDEVFKKFVLMNYNDSRHYLESYDEYLATFDKHGAQEIHLDSNYPPEPEVYEIPPLAAKYISVVNSDECDPEKTPLVRFDLAPLKENEKITIQAIIDPWKEDAKIEDWTDLEEREFCLNSDEEKFDEIALIIASTDRNFPQSAPLLIDLGVSGCTGGDAVATIDVLLTTVEDRDNRPKTGAKIDWTKGQGEVRVKVRAEFELEDEDYDEDTNEITESYLMKSWQIVSSDIRKTSESHYLVEDQYGKLTETKRNSKGQGKAEKSGFLPGGEGNMQIVFDGDTQKAKNVTLPFITVMLTGQSEWNRESTNRSGAPGNWSYYTSTDSGTMEMMEPLPIWHSMSKVPYSVTGIQVTKGDGERSFGGEGEFEDKDEHEKRVYRSTWNVKRNKRKEKE
jgi:hypothetical protein